MGTSSSIDSEASEIEEKTTTKTKQREKKIIKKYKKDEEDDDGKKFSIPFGSSIKSPLSAEKEVSTEKYLNKLEDALTSPEKLEEIMKQLWQKFDTQNTGFLSTDQAKLLFGNIYDYLKKKKYTI